MNNRPRRLGIGLLIALVPALAIAQSPAEPDEEKESVRGRFRLLVEPSGLTKAKKEQVKPPFEFNRSQIAPFDVLPYIKEHHWNTLTIEMRANQFDYDGLIQTAAVPLLGMPQAVVYRRDIHLLKNQPGRVAMQVMFPGFSKTLSLDLLRPEAIRADAMFEASLLKLEPHQMLIPVIGKEAPSYFGWGQRYLAFRMGANERDPAILERLRYYRLVIAQDPVKPPLSPHPLTWTTISHILWDGQSPEDLGSGQQQAMLDWIHWGGQLIVVVGPGSSLAELLDSFLGPFLPAEPSGESALLDATDLAPLARAYPKPLMAVVTGLPIEVDDFSERENTQSSATTAENSSRDQIVPRPNRPIYLEGLRPREGATPIPLSEGDPRLLAVEWRVGRGRVMILGLRLTDPVFAAWDGLDTLIRRLILRRPDDLVNERERRLLAAPELSWVRFVARDLEPNAPDPGPLDPQMSTRMNPSRGQSVTPASMPGGSVGAWLDDARIPNLARALLGDASGISIPDHSFVLRVLVAYAVALVPLNFLICRYLLRRREWAWAVVPVLALGFAQLAVERAAAYDLGFDAACDEIDVLELHGGYPRAHLSRFAALYSTGRVRYTVTYPGDPTALALPMNTNLGVRGQEIEQSTWESAPLPRMSGFQVQPRSLSMFRAEQIVPMVGRIALGQAESGWRVENRTDLDLRDATLVDVASGRQISLGMIAPGASVEVPSEWELEPEPVTTGPEDWARLGPLLASLREYRWPGPQETDAIRLVAWSPRAMAGQSLEPTVDRLRGVTAVIAHLRHGPPPAPDNSIYDFTARQTLSSPPAPAERAERLMVPVRPRSLR